jgi:hypothetical protein
MAEPGTRVHARLIREKPFLRRLYGQYYAAYDATIRRATAGGLIIEVGSGGGFYPTIRRDVISLDRRPGADVDIVASALAMPFPAASASAILLLNVASLAGSHGVLPRVRAVLNPAAACA